MREGKNHPCKNKPMKCLDTRAAISMLQSGVTVCEITLDQDCGGSDQPHRAASRSKRNEKVELICLLLLCPHSCMLTRRV